MTCKRYLFKSSPERLEAARRPARIVLKKSVKNVFSVNKVVFFIVIQILHRTKGRTA